MKLLIVNDEKLTAETMKRDIAWENYGISQVYTAYDAEAGKMCIEEHPIDIMLCDIEMPGENGLALLRWVRENKKEIECVFLTCHASFAYAQEAISLGCQDYILILSKYEDIGKAIQKVVKRIEQQREKTRYQEYGKYMLKEKLKQEEKEKIEPEKIAEEISAFIIKNITNVELSVDKLAEQFHFHPVYFNRVFKKEKGVSVSQFIINERMKMAASILETEQYGANEVAEKVGYSHYTNFYNMFKKYYGCSPAQYLDKHKK
ncbi:MAG: response regulator [Blautia sp.]|nr:response regulator [Blautia sp.]MDY4000890.1 response regulator [Blautia sp.]